MARIWKVRSGKVPTNAGSDLGELSLQNCTRELEITSGDLIRNAGPNGPRFGRQDRVSMFPTHVVVQVGEQEATAFGCEAGFYLSPVSVGDAERLFISASG